MTNQSRYGARAEEHAKDEYGLIDYPGHRYDLQFRNGTPVEVKACMREVSDGANRTRKGRFRIAGHQYDNLLAEDGRYIFILYEAAGPNRINVLACKSVYARTIEGQYNFHETGRERGGGQELKLDWRCIFDNF